MKLRDFSIQTLVLLVCLVAAQQARKTTQGKTRKQAVRSSDSLEA